MDFAVQLFLERIGPATKTRKKVESLAQWLGVSVNEVQDLLSGKRDLYGVTLLRMVHWVQQEEQRGKDETKRPG